MADTAAARDPTITSVDDLSLCHGLTGLAETLRMGARLLHDEALATSATAGIAAFANAWQTGPDALDAAQLPVPSDLGQPNDGAAKMRAAVSAAAGKRRGCSTEGLAGHRKMTTAGVSSAWIRSIVIELTAVIWPEASSVTWDMEILLPFESWLDLLGPAVLQH
jgi:hypothetical protein